MPALATQPQLKKIYHLIDERDLLKSPRFFDAVNAMDEEELAHYLDAIKVHVSTISVAEASRWIDALKDLPVKEGVEPAKPQGPSDGQRRFVETLLAEREVPEAVQETARNMLSGSEPWNRVIIDALKTWPRITPVAGTEAPTAGEALPDVPGGFYAFEKGLVDVPDVGPVEDFFFLAVDRPTEGRWKGRTFVSQVSGGGYGTTGVRHKIKDPQTRRMLLQTVLDVGVQACAQLYGQKIGRCGCCNRNLTDPVSLAYGIGPDCRKQQGWS